jgi:phosphomannomutase/phosphoglucomutase
MAKASAVTAKTNNKEQYSLVRIVLRGAALGLLAVVASFAYLLLYDLPQHNQQRGQQFAGETAVDQAQLLNDWIRQLQARLTAAARDPELLAAFAAPAPDLKPLQLSLQRVFPEAVTVRLVPLGPLGIANVDIGAVGLRNNIEADMLRRVSDGSSASPEAYSFDNSWLISFAQPALATTDKYAAGAILLTVPAAYLEQLLERHLRARGGSAIEQQAGAKMQAFVSAGQGDAEAFSQSQPLVVPRWQLKFTPASAWLDAARQSRLPLLLALALCAAAILAGILICAQDFRRALERNLRALSGNQLCDLPGFAQLRQQLQRRSGAAAPAPVSAPPAPVAVTAAAAPPPAEEPLIAAPTVEELDQLPVTMPDTIFRAYDIRGIARHQLTDDIVYQLGLAIGSEAVDRGEQEIIVARDGRTSSPAIADALLRGLRDSGRDVIDIGMAPTPLLYFATHRLGASSGVVVTGSHNPAEYNGLKIVLGGKTLAGAAITALRERIQEHNFTRGKGEYRSAQIEDQYIDYIVNDVAIAQPLKVVIDAGNGVTGLIAPRLFQELGCEVIPLYCDIDPQFPHHHPDPTVAANLADLAQLVRENGADLGIAFDGDGDRVGVVSASGQIVAADRLLMLLAQDVVARNPGADVLFDVKCSRSLNSLISSYGGRPIMWKSGHSFMKEKMAETGALLGGEFSGHIFFNERWFGFDDGMYAAARLVEILSTTDSDLDAHLAALPVTVSTPELRIDAGEQAKFEVIGKLAAQGKFSDGKITTLDGGRVDFPDGWGLARASNTTPALTLRFEAENDAALLRIQTLFKDQLSAIDPHLQFGF